MKIIAKSSERVYLLEASSDVIDSLAGRLICRRSDYNHEQRERRSVVGTEFAIVPAFQQIHRNSERKEQIERLREIRRTYIPRAGMLKQFAQKFNVRPAAIHGVLFGGNWKGIE